jgi:hypothetical protein
MAQFDPPDRSLMFRASDAVLVLPGSILEVPIAVAGINQPLTGASLAVHIRHRRMDTLSLALMSPDHRVVLLSAFHGGTEQSLGESSARPLVFTDAAPTSIARAIPPLVGAYRPVGVLADFHGLPPSIANGRWQLLLMDLDRSGAFPVVDFAVLTLHV